MLCFHEKYDLYCTCTICMLFSFVKKYALYATYEKSMIYILRYLKQVCCLYV